MNELLARAALAGVVLVLAAVAVTTSGGAGLGGSLGALFGLHSKQGGKSVSAVQVAAPATVKQALASVRLAPAIPALRTRKRTRPQSAPPPRQVPSAQGAPRPAPVGAPVAPQPPAVPAPPPPPAPGPQGNVERTVRTVHDTAAPLAPPAQPVLDQAVTTVNEVCALIGGCP